MPSLGRLVREPRSGLVEPFQVGVQPSLGRWCASHVQGLSNPSRLECSLALEDGARATFRACRTIPGWCSSLQPGFQEHPGPRPGRLQPAVQVTHALQWLWCACHPEFGKTCWCKLNLFHGKMHRFCSSDNLIILLSSVDKHDFLCIC